VETVGLNDRLKSGVNAVVVHERRQHTSSC